MTSYVTPKKNTEFIFYVGLSSQSTGQFQSNPTIAAGDFKVSKDGGALANLSTLPAVTPAASKMVKITLSSTEMDADNVTVVASDAAGDEWDDLIVNIQTSVRQIDDLAFPTTSGRSIDVSAGGEVGLDWGNIGSPTTTVDLSGTSTKALEPQIAGRKIGVDAAGVAGANVVNWNNSAVAAVTQSGVPKVDLAYIDGLATSGNNATLNLKKLNIVNNNGDAFRAVSTGGDGVGGYFEGHNTGYGLDILGGSNQNGLQIDSGSNAGAAIGLSANSPTGNGISIVSTGGSGLFVEGAKGIEIYGDTSDGIYVESTTGGVSINAPQGVIGSDAEDLSVTNITDKVWDEATSGHTTAGTTGKALTDAGSAGDPWGTSLPGAYGAGTAGKIIGDNINATISSRSSHSAADVWAVGTRTLTSFGTLVADIWAYATRTLTAISDSAGVTTLLSRIGSALNILSGKVESNVKQINDTNVTGNGSTTPWGPE